MKPCSLREQGFLCIAPISDLTSIYKKETSFLDLFTLLFCADILLTKSCQNGNKSPNSLDIVTLREA